MTSLENDDESADEADGCRRDRCARHRRCRARGGVRRAPSSRSAHPTGSRPAPARSSSRTACRPPRRRRRSMTRSTSPARSTPTTTASAAPRRWRSSRASRASAPSPATSSSSPELMDSNSLFLTANADTVYYLTGLDLSKGPVVIEQPSNAVGTINDMWFSWIIDIGGPGPDRGLGGKYLIVGPDYDGPLPEGGYFIAHSKTNFALYAVARLSRRQRPQAGGREHQEDHEDLSLPAGRLRHEHRPGARGNGAHRGRAEDPRDEVHRGAPACRSTPSRRATTASSS